MKLTVDANILAAELTRRRGRVLITGSGLELFVAERLEVKKMEESVMKVRAGLLMCVLGVLASCAPVTDTTEPPPPSEAETLGCGKWLSVPTPIGVLSNNAWNEQAAGSFPWRQCLEQRVVDNQVQYGWSWRWPNSGTEVFAYPEVIVGAKPWEPGPGNDSRFPRRIADTDRLRVSYDMEIEARGSYNLAASIWFIRTPTVSNPEDRTAIAAELMVWTEFTPSSFSPSGTKRGEVTIDGVRWEVWVSEDQRDSSGANDISWTYITYRSKSSTRSISYDARKMIEDAMSRGFLSADLYIADVELGTEVMSGTGEAWVKSFSVTID